jgi:hypothetical protein
MHRGAGISNECDTESELGVMPTEFCKSEGQTCVAFNRDDGNNTAR